MTPKIYKKNLHTPKYSFLWKPPKILKYKIFNPQKMAQAYVCMKISEYLPGSKSFQQMTNQTTFVLIVRLQFIIEGKP